MYFDYALNKHFVEFDVILCVTSTLFVLTFFPFQNPYLTLTFAVIHEIYSMCQDLDVTLSDNQGKLR